MNNKTKTIVTIAATLIIGILIGWLVMPDTSGGEKTAQSGQAMDAHDHEDVETWTCSMHPQIRQPEPGKCPICGMDLIPVQEEEGSSDLLTLKMSERAMKLANVQTATVEMEKTVKLITLNGRVAVDERRVFTQTAHFPGRIEELFVNFTGEYVREGQKIASIYSPELVTAQEELFEAKKYANTNPQLVEAARQKLKQWKLTDAQIQKIEASGKVQEDFPIRADRNGYVIKKYVNFGDHLKMGQPIYDMADLSRVWVIFDAYEDDLTWINQGDKVTFEVNSLPGKTFAATITFIDPVIDPQTRVAEVRAELDNPNGLLKPEMFAIGSIEADLEQQDEQMVIPKSAVLWTGPRSVVYVKVPGSEAPAFRLREVTLGPSLGNSYVVEEGLKPGEEIVVNGTYTIDAASELADKPSMMDQEQAMKEQPFPEVPDYSGDASRGFRQKLKVATKHYLEIQHALVNADEASARAAAETLLRALPPAQGVGLGEVAAFYWKGRHEGIYRSANQITSGQSIDNQRKAFVELSREMVRANKAFGVDEVLYIVFCPMANNDEGAYWLSEVEEVLNPYYGDMMLHCGEVKGTIQ